LFVSSYNNYLIKKLTLYLIRSFKLAIRKKSFDNQLFRLVFNAFK